MSENPLRDALLDSDPNGFDCLITQLDEMQGYRMVFTRYQDNAPSYTITTSGADLMACCRNILSFVDRIDADFTDNKLILPDMGDYQVVYHQ